MKPEFLHIVKFCFCRKATSILLLCLFTLSASTSSTIADTLYDDNQTACVGKDTACLTLFAQLNKNIANFFSDYYSEFHKPLISSELKAACKTALISTRATKIDNAESVAYTAYSNNLLDKTRINSGISLPGFGFSTALECKDDELTGSATLWVLLCALIGFVSLCNKRKV